MRAVTSRAMTSPDRVTALDIAAQMEALAAAGEWERIADTAARLRAAILDVPEPEREPVLIAAQQATEKVRAEAKRAHSAVSGKISELRRGQAAKRAYELR